VWGVARVTSACIVDFLECAVILWNYLRMRYDANDPGRERLAGFGDRSLGGFLPLAPEQLCGSSVSGLQLAAR